MMTEFFASRSMASDNAMVKEAGNPSGKTATNMLIASKMEKPRSVPRKYPMTRTKMSATIANATNDFTSRSIFF